MPDITRRHNQMSSAHVIKPSQAVMQKDGLYIPDGRCSRESRLTPCRYHVTLAVMGRPIRLLHANHAFDAGTRIIRTADPGATLELRLQLCEHPGLAAYLRAQAAYADRRFLSLGELRERFGVSANEHSRIRKYLHDCGLEFVSED